MHVDKRIELLEYLLGIASENGDALWRALFAELRKHLIEAEPAVARIEAHRQEHREMVEQ